MLYNGTKGVGLIDLNSLRVHAYIDLAANSSLKRRGR